MKRIILPLILLAALIFIPSGASAGEHEKQIAKEIGNQLITLFKPDAVKVVISNGGSFAWAETKGAVIEGIRIDTMKLRAMLKEVPKSVDSNDKYMLANLIMMSEGEAVLLEKDVNDYFLKGVDTKGFTNLKFDFTPSGFVANGLFTAKFIVTIRIRLMAKGVLGMRPDGVYLEKTNIYVENVKQPDSLTNMILDRINPLLPFTKIPFPVKFKSITMDDNAAVMTSNPKLFTDGESWSWKK